MNNKRTRILVYILISVFVVCFTVIIINPSLSSRNNSNKKELEERHVIRNSSNSKSDNSIKWINIEDALARVKKEPKKIIVDVYTEWCGWCKKMDNITFKDPTISKYINENYYAVKLDAESKDPISIDGKVYDYISRDSEDIMSWLECYLVVKMSYPSLVFIDEKGKIIQSIPGYQTPESLHKILAFF